MPCVSSDCVLDRYDMNGRCEQSSDQIIWTVNVPRHGLQCVIHGTCVRGELIFGIFYCGCEKSSWRWINKHAYKYINQKLRSQGHHSERMEKRRAPSTREQSKHLSIFLLLTSSLPFNRRNVLSGKREFDLPMNNYSILLRLPSDFHCAVLSSIYVGTQFESDNLFRPRPRVHKHI